MLEQFAWWRIRSLVRNVWHFRKALWHYQPWDFSGLLQLMETAARDMHVQHRDHGMAVGSARTARQLLVVSELCKRLRDEDYFTSAGYDHHTWSHLTDAKRLRIMTHAAAMAKQDAHYLGRMFKYVQHWWD